MTGLDLFRCILKVENQRVKKLVVKGIQSHHKTRQNGMQKMPFYLSICGILEINKKQLKIIVAFVELSARGVASE